MADATAEIAADSPLPDTEPKRRNRGKPHVPPIYKDFEDRAKEQFAGAVGKILGQNGMKQSRLVAGINKHLAEKKVPNPKEPGKLLTVGAWDVSRWVRGTHMPPREMVEAVAAVLDVPAEKLLPGITTMDDPNAIVFNTRQVGPDKFYWEFQGAVNAETHRKLMMALSEPL